MKQDMIVILDLGSTENTVLAREIRDMGVYSEIYPHDTRSRSSGSRLEIKRFFWLYPVEWTARLSQHF